MARSWTDIRPVYYGTATERAAFPITGESAGALFFDYDVESWYYWDGAAWQTVPASGGWKFSGNVLVVGPSGDHATFAAAIAAAGAGDIIVVDAGTYTCDNQSIPADVAVIGLSRVNCILLSTTNAITLTLGSGSYVANITVRNERAAGGNRAINVPAALADDPTLFNVYGYEFSAFVGYGIYVDGTVFADQCFFASASGSGCYVTAAGSLSLYGGRHSGDPVINNAAGGDVFLYAVPTLSGPTLISGVWNGAHIVSSALYMGNDAVLDVDQRAAAPPNPAASRWRLWFEADGLHILDSTPAEYIWPSTLAHTHAGAGTGGQLDWDNIWTDAVHDHSAAGEGGQLDWDAVWTDAVHDHSAAGEGGQLDWDSVWSDAVHNHSSAAEGGNFAYTDWTPTVDQGGAVNVTVNEAKYLLVGDLCHVQVRLTATAAGTGGNSIIISGQPAAMQPAVANSLPIGVGSVVDTGVATYPGLLVPVAVTSWYIIDAGTRNYVGLNPNVALGNTDEILFSATYRVA